MPNKPITIREQKAWDFSKEAHQHQVRLFTGKPYFDEHVQKVNGTLKQYTTDEDMLITSLLHDYLEDCCDNIWLGYSNIKEMFGRRVADMTMELTSNSDEIKYRYDGCKTTYLCNKLSNMSSDALTIKLVDRLKNIEDAFTASEKFRIKYFNETNTILDVVESNRPLTKTQTLLLNEIRKKLENINTFFKIK